MFEDAAAKAFYSPRTAARSLLAVPCPIQHPPFGRSSHRSLGFKMSMFGWNRFWKITKVYKIIMTYKPSMPPRALGQHLLQNNDLNAMTTKHNAETHKNITTKPFPSTYYPDPFSDISSSSPAFLKASPERGDHLKWALTRDHQSSHFAAAFAYIAPPSWLGNT